MATEPALNRARELAVLFMGTDDYESDESLAKVAERLDAWARKARLEEAKKWDSSITLQTGTFSPEFQKWRKQRIAALEQRTE